MSSIPFIPAPSSETVLLLQSYQAHYHPPRFTHDPAPNNDYDVAFDRLNAANAIPNATDRSRAQKALIQNIWAKQQFTLALEVAAKIPDSTTQLAAYKIVLHTSITDRNYDQAWRVAELMPRIDLDASLQPIFCDAISQQNYEHARRIAQLTKEPELMPRTSSKRLLQPAFLDAIAQKNYAQAQLIAGLMPPTDWKSQSVTTLINALLADQNYSQAKLVAYQISKNEIQLNGLRERVFYQIIKAILQDGPAAEAIAEEALQMAWDMSVEHYRRNDAILAVVKYYLNHNNSDLAEQAVEWDLAQRSIAERRIRATDSSRADDIHQDTQRHAEQIILTFIQHEHFGHTIAYRHIESEDTRRRLENLSIAMQRPRPSPAAALHCPAT